MAKGSPSASEKRTERLKTINQKRHESETAAAAAAAAKAADKPPVVPAPKPVRATGCGGLLGEFDHAGTADEPKKSADGQAPPTIPVPPQLVRPMCALLTSGEIADIFEFVVAESIKNVDGPLTERKQVLYEAACNLLHPMVEKSGEIMALAKQVLDAEHEVAGTDFARTVLTNDFKSDYSIYPPDFVNKLEAARVVEDTTSLAAMMFRGSQTHGPHDVNMCMTTPQALVGCVVEVRHSQQGLPQPLTGTVTEALFQPAIDTIQVASWRITVLAGGVDATKVPKSGALWGEIQLDPKAAAKNSAGGGSPVSVVINMAPGVASQSVAIKTHSVAASALLFSTSLSQGVRTANAKMGFQTKVQSGGGMQKCGPMAIAQLLHLTLKGGDLSTSNQLELAQLACEAAKQFNVSPERLTAIVEGQIASLDSLEASATTVDTALCAIVAIMSVKASGVEILPKLIAELRYRTPDGFLRQLTVRTMTDSLATPFGQALMSALAAVFDSPSSADTTAVTTMQDVCAALLAQQLEFAKKAMMSDLGVNLLAILVQRARLFQLGRVSYPNASTHATLSFYVRGPCDLPYGMIVHFAAHAHWECVTNVVAGLDSYHVLSCREAELWRIVEGFQRKNLSLTVVKPTAVAAATVAPRGNIRAKCSLCGGSFVSPAAANHKHCTSCHIQHMASLKDAEGTVKRQKAVVQPAPAPVTVPTPANNPDKLFNAVLKHVPRRIGAIKKAVAHGVPIEYLFRVYRDGSKCLYETKEKCPDPSCNRWHGKGPRKAPAVRVTPVAPTPPVAPPAPVAPLAPRLPSLMAPHFDPNVFLQHMMQTLHGFMSHVPVVAPPAPLVPPAPPGSSSASYPMYYDGPFSTPNGLVDAFGRPWARR